MDNRMQEQQIELEAYQEQEREKYYREEHEKECNMKRNKIMEECRKLITPEIIAFFDREEIIDPLMKNLYTIMELYGVYDLSEYGNVKILKQRDWIHVIEVFTKNMHEWLAQQADSNLR